MVSALEVHSQVFLLGLSFKAAEPCLQGHSTLAALTNILNQAVSRTSWRCVIAIPD